MNKLSLFKIIIRTLIISILVIYFGCIILLHIPSVQQGLGRAVTNELENILQTDVEVGNIDLGLLNRIIIQDVKVHDRNGKQMIKASRLSAKFDIMPLFEGKIRIQSIQLFGTVVRLGRKDAASDLNFRFLIDAFASKDSEKKGSVDLRINSLLIRRGELHYDVDSAPETPGVFNTSHVKISNLSANFSLKALQADSLNVQIKRMSFTEKSGFQLRRLQLKATANERGCMIRDLDLTLPNGYIRIDSLKAHYRDLLVRSDSTFLNYEGSISAGIIPADLSSFIPALQHFEDSLRLDINLCSKEDVHSIRNLRMSSPHNEVLFVAKGDFTPPSGVVPAQIRANIRHAEVTQKGFKWLFKNITGEEKVPVILQRLGDGVLNAELKGSPYNLDTKLAIRTDLGSIMGRGSMITDTLTSKRSFTGRLFTEALQLGTLVGNKETFGNTSFNLDFKGLSYHKKSLKSYIKGTIHELEYKRYKYHNILLDGHFKPGDFSGRVELQDENAQVLLDGSFSTSGVTPVFDLKAFIKNFRPEELHLTKKYPDTSFSGNLIAKFSGNHIDNIKGFLSIDSLSSTSKDQEYSYTLPHFHILAQPIASGKEIAIKSPFVNGRIYGNYSYESVIPSIHKLALKYVPALWPGIIKGPINANIFKFDLDIENTETLKRIFRLPVDLQMPATIHGWFDDLNTQLYLNANIPQISINNKRYESIHLLLENPQNALSCQARGNIMMNKGSMINLSLDTKALNDSLHTTIHWGNNTNVTYSGRVNASTFFHRDEKKKQLLTDINLHPGHFILNDTVWNIHPAKVMVHTDSIDIQDFSIEHQNQFVHINGRLGNNVSDTCLVNLRDINILYLLDMIQFEAVRFEGNASGKIQLASVLKKPSVDAHLDVKDFRMNHGLLGRANIKGGFDNEKGRILLDADIPENNSYSTQVKGFVSIKDKGLDLSIGANGTNLSILAPFMEGIFSDVQGRINGNIRLFGPFKGLDLEGDARAHLGLTVDALNTRFNAVSDSIHITSGNFQFNDVKLTDIHGNSGTVNGYLRHDKFKNLRYRFGIEAQDMLIFSTTEGTPDYPFYGKIFATGNTLIQGNPQDGLSVEARLRAENKTSFVYVLGAAAQATSNQFITFVDRTPRRAHEQIKTDLYHYLNQKEIEEEDDDPMDIRLNLLIEPTPLAEMRVLMDPVAGDYISAKGTGNLRVNFFNKGDFQMFGNYNISEGIYKISMQNVIRKDFKLRPGGSVSFNGNPKAANLNLQAVHTVPSASLNDLVPDASSSRGNVRVNCIVNLSGNLTSPNMTFDLELPTVNEEDKQLVRSLTSTPEQMTTQIIYLLGVGKFYAFDYANQANQSNATSSLAFNTLSGQLNNMLSQVIDNQNWNVGTNLSTGQNGWSDVEAEAILSGRLLNNRLIINGNFGYRENTLQNSNFVGDFEAVWLLTKNGDFRLRGYNMTNDRYFTKSTMTTQGVGFIYKKDFTHWGEIFDWLTNFKRHRKEKLRKKQNKEEKEVKDTENEHQTK